LATACGSSGKATTRFSAPAPMASASWLYPNGDLANTRDAVGSTITLANVSKLKEAWTFKLSGTAAAGVTGTGALTANPIVQNGLVYLQDLDCNVYAVALATGRLEWEYKVDTPEQSGPGPNGVAVAGGVVYGATPTSVFALSARTGRKVWVNQTLLNKGQGTFGIQPQVVDGRVYLASQYGSGPGGGVLLALSAATGKVLWRFNTVTGPEPGVKALGVGAGGAWETPLVRADGSVTFGIGNPYQSVASAIAHPSQLLYTNSDLNLSAATGKLHWYYQAVPDDFKDYDMQASPIAARIDGAPAVLGGGKMGDVYAMNAATGKLIWKTPVGEHNGHDNDSLQALEGTSTLKAPYSFLPGSIGGILTNMAVAGNTVYVVTCDYPFTFSSLKQIDGLPKKGAPLAGQVEALNLTTGRVEWDTKVASLPLGAATVSNNLVFTTLVSGVLIALDRTTGAIVYHHRLPTTANSPIAVAGNTVLVPAGRPGSAKAKGVPQLVAYTVP
jgi:alcohol dehydrogenase (cytochrome c)